MLGSAQALARDLANAVKNFQTAARLAPDQAEPYYRMALTFLQGYRDQDAEEVLLTGLRQIPNSPLLLLGLGTVREVLGDYQRSIEYMRKSVDAKNDQPAVWAILGELYSKVGQHDRALEAYQTPIARQASPETAVKYADVLIRLQHFGEAKKTAPTGDARPTHGKGLRNSRKAVQRPKTVCPVGEGVATGDRD